MLQAKQVLLVPVLLLFLRGHGGRVWLRGAVLLGGGPTLLAAPLGTLGQGQRRRGGEVLRGSLGGR